MSPIAVFDIDGTLTRTQELDESCYARAVRDALGIEGISTDWGAYEHSTDVAILRQLVRERHGRAATDEEIDRTRDRFAALVEEALRAAPPGGWEVRGARHALGALPSHGWRVALASGGFERTARMKLRAAGFPAELLAAIPSAFAEDAPARVDIIRAALARAGGAGGPVCYIGDGTWDVHAARQGGYRVVGIGRGARAEALRAAGADGILDDLGDLPRLLAALAGSTRQEVH